MVTSRELTWRLVAGVLTFNGSTVAFSQPASRPLPQAAATMPSDAELQATLEAAIRELQQHRLDMGIDGLEQAEARDDVIRSFISQVSKDLRKRAVDDAAMALLPLDALTQRGLVAPRLSGRLVRVGEGTPFKDLADAIPTLVPGDLIVLGAGTFTLPDSRRQPKWNDMALVGMGVNQTTLKVTRAGTIEDCARFLIEGIRVDCLGDPLTDVRDGPGFMLRRCELMNYNSGSGGSNALYSSGGMVWLDECLFDGAKGSAGGRGVYANPLDIRGDAMVFARKCQFVDNQHVDGGSTFAMFDRCTMLNSQRGRGVTPYGARFWARDSDSLIDKSNAGPSGFNSFVHATDDVEFIGFVLDPSKPIDEDSKLLANTLQLHRRLPYWIGLIHHDDARIRGFAAKKITELTGEEVHLPKDQPREGERLADAGVLLEIEKEYARLMNWLDANRARLKWDEEAGRYRIEYKPAEQPK